MAHAAEMTAALDDEDFPIQIPQKLAPPQVQEGPLVGVAKLQEFPGQPSVL